MWLLFRFLPFFFLQIAHIQAVYSAPNNLQDRILVAPRADDLAIDLVDRLEVRSAFAVDAMGLQNGSVKSSPWSDSYWPIYQGMLANRYADPKFPASYDWKENNDYLLSALSKTDTPIELKSPAEKYDILMGDSQFSLTRKMLFDGQGYYERSGEVEAWMGLCHGWAAASLMYPRPAKKIILKSAQGIDVPFYPSDIKALGTLLWSNGRYSSRFIGGRCNDKEPALDSARRPTSFACYDNNSATWHLSLVNQVGLAGKSIIIDASFDYEVWNHPVLTYEFRYFNPKSTQVMLTADSAKILASDWGDDPYKNNRDPRTKYIVGVINEYQYLVETAPSHEELDSPKYDQRMYGQTRYDLELDAEGNIIGGEWHRLEHPDFLWIPANPSIKTFGDDWLDRRGDRSTWDIKEQKPVPAAWQSVAPRASQMGQPLRRVVEAMFEYAK